MRRECSVEMGKEDAGRCLVVREASIAGEQEGWKEEGEVT
jgi:hypothetical protein